MDKKCPFRGIEHDKLLDSVSDTATNIAEEFTEKSFDKIWNFGGKDMVSEMSQKEVAKMMFHTGATQMLTEYLMNELENKCKNKS